jgi:2-polyprenyl-6-methoxyphenol hydroxylase-like FAD-dependent oxidoreductase
MSNKAIIAGGSLAGLMTGIVMKAIGVDARIYERSPKVLDDRGAGIVMQAETETFLTQYAGLRREQTGVRLKYRQYLNRQGTPDSYQEMPQCMTSWGLIYRALRGSSAPGAISVIVGCRQPSNSLARSSLPKSFGDPSNSIPTCRLRA